MLICTIDVLNIMIIYSLWRKKKKTTTTAMIKFYVHFTIRCKKGRLRMASVPATSNTDYCETDLIIVIAKYLMNSNI